MFFFKQLGLPNESYIIANLDRKEERGKHLKG